MPVKIQELVIQTKIKSGAPDLANNKGTKYVTQQELNQLQAHVVHTCTDTMDHLLQEHQER